METPGTLIKRALDEGKIKRYQKGRTYHLHPDKERGLKIGIAPHRKGVKLSDIIQEWKDAGAIPKDCNEVVVEYDYESNRLEVREATEEDNRKARAVSPRRSK